MPEPTPTPWPMCPMAEACQDLMTKRRFSGFGLAMPGVAFIVLGILILIEPRILAWVIAAAFVVLGAMMLMMTGFIRRIGRGFQGPLRPGH